MQHTPGGPRRTRVGLAATCAAALTLASSVAGSSAAVTATQVNEPPAAGHNITVFPARDFVSASGYGESDTVTVAVIHPSGVVRSTASGLVPQDDPATDRFDGIVEVNHPGGNCWADVTPDVRPQDKVRITVDAGPNAGIADQTTTADVTAGRPVKFNADTVVVHGLAADAAGAPLPIGQIESRLVVPGDAFDLTGKRTMRAPGFGTIAYDAPGSTSWTATYTGLTAADVDRALGSESRVLWLGANPAAGTEATIFENGAGIVPGPSAPCTAPPEKLPPPPGTEAEPPSVPLDLVPTVANSNQVTLNWTASSDNVGVTSYGVYRDGVAIANVQNADASAPAPSTFVDRNVPPGDYTYTVDAADAAGNRSDQSAGAAATTTARAASAATTNTPPVAPVAIIGFPSRDFVSSEGFEETDSVTVEVIRDGAVVADAPGVIPQDDPTTPDFEGLVEVNHPGGACWDGTTPELRAGDVVRTTAYRPDGTIRTIDQTTVANVVATGAREIAPGTGVVEIHGVAQDAQGRPLPIEQLEQRLVIGRLRFDANGRRTLRADSAGAGAGTMSYDTENNPLGTRWTATYTGLDAADVQRALDAESRILWLGADPLAGTELTIFEHPGEAGPAAGFCASPLEPADRTAPSAPHLSASQTAASTVHLVWSASTDDVAVAGYRVFRDGQPVRNLGPAATATDVAGVPVGSHTWSVRALDTASPLGAGTDDAARLDAGVGGEYGNLSAESNVVTLDQADVTAPAVPANLVATAGTGAVTLTWSASADDIGVALYTVYRDGTKVADVAPSATPRYVDEPLAADTYNYTVDAIDAAGNRSARSHVATATVSAVADTTRPTVPGSFAADLPDIHGRDVVLSWTAATDEVGVTGYGVYRNGVKIAEVNGDARGFRDANRPAGTYTYEVDAVDSAGNRSARASAVAVVANEAPVLPHSIIAFPQRDFVSADGFAGASSVTVSVLRQTATGAWRLVTQSEPVPPASGIVEVNHPGGGCWTVNTPDIRPGDVVRTVTDTGVADQTTVADVRAGRPVQTAAGTVVVHGTAARPGGGRIPLDQLEQRLISSSASLFDKNGRRALIAPADGTLAYDSATGIGWTATYSGLTQADVTRIMEAESRVLWLGTAPLAGAELTIYENGAGVVGGPSAPCTAPLEPTAAQASATPASVAFGSQGAVPPTVSAGRTVTLSNAGSAPLAVQDVSLAGADAGQFRITANGCGASVAPSASCGVTVAFAPTSVGTKIASLELGSNAANVGNLSIPLTGTGVDNAAPGTPGAPVQGLPPAAAGGGVTVLAPIDTSTVTVNVDWTAAAGTVARYELEVSKNGGAFAPTATQPGTALRQAVALAMGAPAASSSATTNSITYQFRVRACASTGNCSAYATGPRFGLIPVDSANTAKLAFGGTWTTAAVAGSYGGTVRFASTAKDKATLNKMSYTVTGNVGWISTTGPDRGRATVSVDGGPAVTVDLYSPTLKPAQLVFATDNLRAGVEHTFTVQVLGTRSTASSGTRVDFDGAIAIR